MTFEQCTSIYRVIGENTFWNTQILAIELESKLQKPTSQSQELLGFSVIEIPSTSVHLCQLHVASKLYSCHQLLIDVLYRSWVILSERG